MNYFSKPVIFVALTAVAVPAIMIGTSHASDHADTPTIVANPGTDITDVFLFPSPENSNNVVMVMDVRPLIAPGTSATVSFDPNVLYQFTTTLSKTRSSKSSSPEQVQPKPSRSPAL